MKAYTIPDKIKKILIKAGVIAIWLLLWQLTAAIVGSAFLFPPPLTVIKRLFELAVTPAFLKSCAFTLMRISAGCLLGIIAGTAMGVISAFSKPLRAFFSPALTVIKTTPVASFIILLLLWLSRTGVTVAVSCLLVAPILWANTAQGIASADRGLIEMSRLYGFSRLKRFANIYAPAALPSFSAGVTTAIGFAWKSGISAEVIATPEFAIGTSIYRAKLGLEYTDLFAWTLAVIILSLLIEKTLVFLLKKFVFERRKRHD